MGDAFQFFCSYDKIVILDRNENMMVIIKATVFFEKGSWKCIFERIDRDDYSPVRYMFEDEPTEQDLYEFILTHSDDLDFGEFEDFQLQLKHRNPKKTQRESYYEAEDVQETKRSSSFNQDYELEEIGKKSKDKKPKRSIDKQVHVEEKLLFSKKKEVRKN